MTRIAVDEAGGPKVCAFLDMLSWSEGTAGHGDDGYNVLVGGELFHSYDDHPRILVTVNSKGLKSTAAGRYQELKRTFDDLSQRLGTHDMQPVTQDKHGIELIRQQKALPHVIGGDIRNAIRMCAPIWASLPGAGYGQHENKMEPLMDAYFEALAKYA